MKEVIKLYTLGIFIILLIIVTLTACEEKLFSPPESDFNVINSKGVYMITEKTQYTLKEKYIHYSIVNNTNLDFQKNEEDFFLEIYTESGWQKYPFSENRKKTLEAYEGFMVDISKGESANLSFKVGVNFDTPIKKGYYRISQFGVVSNAFKVD